VDASCAPRREPSHFSPALPVFPGRLFQLSNGSNPDKMGDLMLSS